MSVSRFDLDQDAIDWARGHVERVRDKWRAWEYEARDKGDGELMLRCRRIANVLDMELIGGKGCVITAFDQRRPEMLRAMGDTVSE